MELTRFGSPLLIDLRTHGPSTVVSSRRVCIQAVSPRSALHHHRSASPTAPTPTPRASSSPPIHQLLLRVSAKALLIARAARRPPPLRCVWSRVSATAHHRIRPPKLAGYLQRLESPSPTSRRMPPPARATVCTPITQPLEDDAVKERSPTHSLPPPVPPPASSIRTRTIAPHFFTNFSDCEIDHRPVC